MELFSDLGEEKQLSAIKINCPEAKSNKSIDTFTYLGRYINYTSLDWILNGMKQVFSYMNKYKIYVLRVIFF